MKKVWFTSDCHFNQERALIMSKRPFDTVSDMNDTMIRNWNRNVGKDDVVFILGDFGDYKYAQYLNGDKIGIIEDKDDLYDLINDKQKQIKKKYNVEAVYPPNDFKITKLLTYNNEVDDIDFIYNKIEEVDNFTPYALFFFV